jgi:hypothetical protein
METFAARATVPIFIGSGDLVIGFLGFVFISEAVFHSLVEDSPNDLLCDHASQSRVPPRGADGGVCAPEVHVDAGPVVSVGPWINIST